MRKTNAAIENSTQLFAEIKQYMKMKGISRIRIQELKQFTHSSSTQDSLLGKIMQYINSKSRFDRNMPPEQCCNVLRGLLNQDKVNGNKFQIDPEIGIHYISKYQKVVDQKTLLQEIQSTPEGLLVDEELLKFSHPDIKNYIQNLIYARLIIPIKSKNIDKSKIKDSNYEGYYLFSFPPEVKESQFSIFCPQIQKRQFESLVKNLQEREEKLKKVYKTKISHYRKDFENICSANVNKGQSKGGQQQNSQSLQKMFSSWNEINRMSVPNFEREAEEWHNNRKL